MARGVGSWTARVIDGQLGRAAQAGILDPHARERRVRPVLEGPRDEVQQGTPIARQTGDADRIREFQVGVQAVKVDLVLQAQCAVTPEIRAVERVGKVERAGRHHEVYAAERRLAQPEAAQRAEQGSSMMAPALCPTRCSADLRLACSNSWRSGTRPTTPSSYSASPLKAAAASCFMLREAALPSALPKPVSNRRSPMNPATRPFWVVKSGPNASLRNPEPHIRWKLYTSLRPKMSRRFQVAIHLALSSRVLSPPWA